MMTFLLPDDMEVNVSVVFVDRFNRPTKPPEDVVITWATSDASMLTATPTPDGLSATLRTADVLAPAQVSARASFGETELFTIFDVEGVTGTAVSDMIVPGPLRPRTDVPAGENVIWGNLHE